MNVNQQRKFSYYFATTKPDFEEMGPCKKELFDYKICLEFEEGEFSYCKREQLLYKLCLYEKKVNLQIFKDLKINSEKYEEICE